MSSVARPVALTIAGSDSGGGAGIQADLKTFHAFGVFGTSAVTAITAQNTIGVSAVHAVPLDVVRAQIDAVVPDLQPAAVKTGMLASAELVRSVAAAITEHGLTSLVVDPVMVATSGDRLLDEDAEASLVRDLLPLAAVVTPNLYEAAILTGSPVDDLDDMRAAARTLAVQARARYDAGLADILSVAEAERLLSRAETEDALARLEVWRSRFAVGAAEGDLQPILIQSIWSYQ